VAGKAARPPNLPHSCACHRNPAGLRLQAERTLERECLRKPFIDWDALTSDSSAAWTRGCWIPVTSTGMREIGWPRCPKPISVAEQYADHPHAFGLSSRHLQQQPLQAPLILHPMLIEMEDLNGQFLAFAVAGDLPRRADMLIDALAKSDILFLHRRLARRHFLSDHRHSSNVPPVTL
jgi:hypothetical protein